MITLTDTQVRSLLEGLTSAELNEFREVFSNALHQYSTDTGTGDNSVFQTPHRTSTYSANSGATTLYMPCCGPQGMGIKVVTLSSPKEGDSDPTQPSIRPTGALSLFGPTGEPLGFLHCGTLTGFRTALASMCLVHRRKKVKTLTAFGAGLQAYWHIRLSLMLRGSEVKKVHLINKSFSEGARQTLKSFYEIPAEVKQREGWADTQFDLLTPGYGEFDRVVKENLRAADVIFCCTPSTKDLFDGSILTAHEGRRKGRLIVAVGSYQPHMRELPEALVMQAVKHSDKKCTVHYHKHAQEGGVIVVDTIAGVKTEAGEIIHSKIDPSRLVELGELVMLRKMDESEQDTEDHDDEDDGCETPHKTPCNSSTTSLSPDSASSSSTSLHKRSLSRNRATERSRKDTTLNRWLYKGNVIYKSVGMGVMDLVAGMHVIKLAKAKGIGMDVPGF
ncbi:hypothetical protein TD95_001533 [Thielaviopsis punctulata]|uniref:Ornithine cyclodeaminase n=1 Tax=Thielaviopsis punctulata TaxID=72032 RepID=A0A0F4ZJH5_9PEZI|nr:hypothetical protein TD95_001533 [Thielaviopsis punctulata]